MTRLIAPPVTYRIYDEADRLLYVGVSHEPSHRVSQHRSGKAWGQRIARVTETFWRDPVDALLDERAATYHEAPEFPTVVAGNGANHTARTFVASYRCRNGLSPVDPGAALAAGGYLDVDDCTPKGPQITAEELRASRLAAQYEALTRVSELLGYAERRTA